MPLSGVRTMANYRVHRAVRGSSGLIAALVLLSIWQAIIGLGLVNFQYLPAPIDIGRGGIAVIRSGELGAVLAHTLQSVLLSWLAASVVGIAGGLLIGLVRNAGRLSSTTIELLRPLPAIGFLPVAIVVLGLSTSVEVIVAAYAAVWPVLINTAGAVETVNPTLLEVGHVFGLSRMKTGTRIVLPAAIPAVLVGVRLALGVALVVVVAVEMVGVPQGIGYALVMAQQSLQPAEMFFYIGVAGLLGVLLNMIVTRASALAMPGFPALAGDHR